jgi:hypothetical protein
MDTIQALKNLVSENEILKQSLTKATDGTFCCQYWLLLLIILTTGVIGGLVNYLFVKPPENDGEKNMRFYLDKIFYYHILLAICGSALIPLFLYITSSKLFTQCDNCFFVYFVFAGYCLIGAVFARSILDNLSRKIFNIEKEQEKQKQEIQNVKKEIQKEIDESIMPEDFIPETKITDLSYAIEPLSTNRDIEEDVNIKAKANTEMALVLDTLQKSNFKYFTIPGISKRTKVHENNVFIIIDAFRKSGIVTSVELNNREYLMLTKIGKDFKLIY